MNLVEINVDQLHANMREIGTFLLGVVIGLVAFIVPVLIIVGTIVGLVNFVPHHPVFTISVIGSVFVLLILSCTVFYKVFKFFPELKAHDVGQV